MTSYKLDECLWEMGKGFAYYKLKHIIWVNLNTNQNGNEITIGIYKVDQFSHEKIAYIIESFNALLHYFGESMTWENVTFSVEQYVTEISDNVNLYKYIFSTKENSDQNLARQNFFQLALI